MKRAISMFSFFVPEEGSCHALVYHDNFHSSTRKILFHTVFHNGTTESVAVSMRRPSTAQLQLSGITQSIK